MEENDFTNSFVYIKNGRYKGRIGYCDDIDEPIAFVSFGHALFAPTREIPIRYLSQINTDVLINRHKDIAERINVFEKNISQSKKITLLEEYILIDNILMDRLFKAQFIQEKKGKSIFLSHSSKDKEFVKWLSVDISKAGHTVWLDEWDILPGQSIPHEISTGIEKCNFVLVILSPNSVNSQWVENEWHAKYWSEIKAGKIKVIPVLFKKCKIPTLLRTKKYADFTKEYTEGLENLLLALKKL